MVIITVKKNKNKNKSWKGFEYFEITLQNHLAKYCLKNKVEDRSKMFPKWWKTINNEGS